MDLILEAIQKLFSVEGLTLLVLCLILTELKKIRRGLKIAENADQLKVLPEFDHGISKRGPAAVIHPKAKQHFQSKQDQTNQQPPAKEQSAPAGSSVSVPSDSRYMPKS